MYFSQGFIGLKNVKKMESTELYEIYKFQKIQAGTQLSWTVRIWGRGGRGGQRGRTIVGKRSQELLPFSSGKLIGDRSEVVHTRVSPAS